MNMVASMNMVAGAYPLATGNEGCVRTRRGAASQPTGRSGLDLRYVSLSCTVIAFTTPCFEGGEPSETSTEEDAADESASCLALGEEKQQGLSKLALGPSGAFADDAGIRQARPGLQVCGLRLALADDRTHAQARAISDLLVPLVSADLPPVASAALRQVPLVQRVFTPS